jgi:hypothetical protein
MRLVAPRFVITLRRVSVNGKRLAMSLRICSSFLVVGVVITEKKRGPISNWGATDRP